MGFRAVGLAALLGAAVVGQASAAPVAHPDLSGIYAFARGDDLKGFKPVGMDLDPLVTAHLQPWAKVKMDATNTEAEDTGAVCQLAGIFRHPTTVAGFQLIPEADKILMISSIIQEVGVRRIYLTDKHPANLPATWLGHSIGHWEGDTLVVDTVGFNDKSWLMSGMQPHTEELHVVERIRPVAGGSLIEVVTTVDDWKALTSPYSYSRYYKKTDAEPSDEVCNGEPGEPQRWQKNRNAAIERQRASRADATASAQ